MASQYGWDWGINIAGAGIWKSLAIESWSGVRLAAIRPLASLDEATGAGRLTTHVDLEWSTPQSAPALVTVAINEHSVIAEVQAGQPSTVLDLEVSGIDPWWPIGYGSQPLYDVSVIVSDDRADLQTWTGRVGFRNITLSTAPDVHGSEFVIMVNSQPIYIKGANWIPDDAMVTRLTADTYRASITHALDAGMNLLRIWGGGMYESEHFYSLCDELGILVWQDFLFACAAYSEEEPLRSEVEAEAREAISRLSKHASLALWNGNNENIWGYVDWGWRAQLGDLTWGDGYYTDLLPRLVAELDPRTPYSPGSPYSFGKYHHPNDVRFGTMHIWDVWNRLDYTHYRDYPARFASEFGFQGPAAWSTLTSVVHDQPLDPYGPEMLVHQKAGDGNAKLEAGLGDHLPKWSTEPTANMDDWHWLTSLNQARAVAYGIEHFRSHYPLNMGTIIWQLNDNWPVISWSAVDFAEIRKPLWHALSRVYQPKMITVQPRPDESGAEVPTVIAHNDTGEVWDGELIITRRSTGIGTPVLAEQKVPFHLDPRTAVSVPLDADVLTADDPSAELIMVAAEGARNAFHYFVEDTALTVVEPAQAYEVEVRSSEARLQVVVTAQALVKDLALFPDRLDAAARVDSGLITLLAGETHTFVVTGASGLDEGALASLPVLRSVNDLIA